MEEANQVSLQERRQLQRILEAAKLIAAALTKDELALISRRGSDPELSEPYVSKSTLDAS